MDANKAFFFFFISFKSLAHFVAEFWPVQISIRSGNVWIWFRGYQCARDHSWWAVSLLCWKGRRFRHVDLSCAMPLALMLRAQSMACFTHITTELGGKWGLLLGAHWTHISTWGQRPLWHTLAYLEVEMLVTWRIPPQEHFLFSLCCKHVCLFVCRLHFLIRRESLYSFRRKNSRLSLFITVI